jgi:hypothetical protein
MREAMMAMDAISACWHPEGYGEIWFDRTKPTTLRAVREVAARLSEWQGPIEPARILIDVVGAGTVERDVVTMAVREYFERGRIRTAEPVLAFVAHDFIPSTFLLFLQLTRAKARTFRDPEEARRWLLGHPARVPSLTPA